MAFGRYDVGDLGLLAFLIAFAAIHVANMVRFRDFTALAQLVYTLTNVLALLVRQPALTPVSTGVAAKLVVFGHTLSPLLFYFSPPVAGYPLPGEVLAIVGLAIASLGMLELWDSYGLLPGHRGLKTRGLYGVVRHPIYLGYCIMVLGWMVHSPSGYNLGVAAIFAVLAHARMELEESVLRRDDEYQKYAAIVRQRVVPLIY